MGNKKYIVRRHDGLFLLDIDETGQVLWTEDMQKAFILSERDTLYERMHKFCLVTLEKKEEVFSFVQVTVTTKK
jgi:hypothetical protein